MEENLKKEVSDFLKRDCDASNIYIDYSIDKLEQHPEILEEFLYYMKHADFKPNGISIEGYTAKYLCEEYHFTMLGAYDYLTLLAEHPATALEGLEKRTI